MQSYFQLLRKGLVLDTGENLSITCLLLCSFNITSVFLMFFSDDDRKGKQCVRLRWDKADLGSHYYATYANLSRFSLDMFN